jgi:1,2-diacylglycerol 3-alpha-glucosyltransferase
MRETRQSGTPSRTLAVVFSRLGPYHLARLRGAREVLSAAGVGLASIAIAGQDRVYAWDPVQAPDGFPARVLFPDCPYEDVPIAALVRALRACLDEVNPLAVALPGWAFTEAREGLRWCRGRHRPAILMSESSHADHFRLWPREVLKRRMVRRFGAALVGGSRHREYARLLGIPRAAIFTGYDAVDNAYFHRGAERIRANAVAERVARGLPDRYWLTISRFVRKKNIDRLLQAYARYASRAAAPRDLVLCGDGPERERLQRLAGELGIGPRVRWPGFVQYPDLPAYYGLAEAFVLASTTEQWGLVVNEAMASGLPVLVSDRCGCATDLVRDGENGFRFNPHDVDDMVRVLQGVPDDATALARMGDASRRIVARWDIRAFGEGLLDAARMVVARAGLDALDAAGGAA